MAKALIDELITIFCWEWKVFFFSQSILVGRSVGGVRQMRGCNASREGGNVDGSEKQLEASMEVRRKISLIVMPKKIPSYAWSRSIINNNNAHRLMLYCFANNTMNEWNGKKKREKKSINIQYWKKEEKKILWIKREEFILYEDDCQSFTYVCHFIALRKWKINRQST